MSKTELIAGVVGLIIAAIWLVPVVWYLWRPEFPPFQLALVVTWLLLAIAALGAAVFVPDMWREIEKREGNDEHM
jgi:hypothetical protein